MPTVVEKLPAKSTLAQSEVFGPVCSLHSFSDFNAVLQICNDTPFGLQAGIFTNDIHKVFAAYRKLKYGGVVINDVPSIRAEAMPVHTHTGARGRVVGRAVCEWREEVARGMVVENRPPLGSSALRCV